MASPPVTAQYATKGLRSWSKQLEAYKIADTERQQLQELLLNQVAELTTALSNARTDLDDETESRRKWRKRAEDAESKVARNQFSVLLIDGNNFVFKTDALRSGAAGAAEISRTLLAEARSFIKSRHMADLPEDFQIVVYIFADLGHLGLALRESGTLLDENILSQFNYGLAQSQPQISFLDCGPGKAAVEAKMRYFYELYVEDCHCRHLILALDPSSEYFAVLDSYSEDELTISKTSLIKSIHGLPSKYNLPFTVADFSSLETLPLISLGSTAESVHESRGDTGGSPSHDLRTLQIDDGGKTLPSSPLASDPGNFARPRSLTRNPPSQEDIDIRRGNSLSSANVAQAVSSSSSGISQAVSSNSSLDPVKSQEVAKSSRPAGGSLGRSQDDMAITPSIQQPHSITRPFQDSYQTVVSSYMHDWENAPQQDLYTTPVNLTPWGASEDISWADDMNEEISTTNHIGQNPVDYHVPNGSTREGGVEREGATSRQALANRHAKKERSYLETRKEYQQSRYVSDVNRGPKATSSSERKTLWTGHSSESGPVGIVSSSLSSSKFAPAPEDSNSMRLPIRSDVSVNRLGQRIDRPLPMPRPSDQARLDLRGKSRRLCNEHHLRQACRSDKCKFDHDPVDEGMRLALRHLARRLPCSIGPSCRRSECFHGHHCPYQTNRNCKNAKCAFKARGLHDVVDLTVTQTIPS